MKHFTLDEFNCQHCGRNEMDPHFLLLVDQLRDVYGKPLVVSSGYRCPDHNARVSSTGRTGPHTTGKAADFAISRGPALELLRLAVALPFTGVGVQQRGAGRFIHLDTIPNAPGSPRPTIWSY